MVNNSTNINKTNNNVSPWKGVNIDVQQFHQYQHNNTNLSAKESLSSEGQQFYQYQQNKQ